MFSFTPMIIWNKEVNDELIEKVLKWTDKVLDGVDLNEKLPDENK